MSKIPVHIITGFLGAGKTTFLNQFIKEVLPQRVLVIENEVGEINIDGALVFNGVEEVIELSAGCLCCSLSDSLLDVLEFVSERHDQYDRVVIETTGIADPSSIVQVFLADTNVGRFFDLQQVICLTDAGLIEDWLKEAEEALRQLVIADVILINKADTVSPTYLAELQIRLNSINPNALTITGEQGVFSSEQILKEGITKAHSVEDKLEHISIQQHNEYLEGNADNNNHQITTFTLVFDAPFDLKELSLQLYRMVNLYRHQVYRIKGIMSVVNYPNRVILQSVRTSCIVTDGSPWGEDQTRLSKLVFIGRGLKKEAFERMFSKYLVTQVK